VTILNRESIALINKGKAFLATTSNPAFTNGPNSYTYNPLTRKTVTILSKYDVFVEE
jgi:hypothetical protein